VQLSYLGKLLKPENLSKWLDPRCCQQTCHIPVSHTMLSFCLPWLLTAFQSLRLHQGNICILLPVISWLCRHIAWVPMDVGPSLLPVRWRGTLYWNRCMILFTPPPCLHVYWRHFFSLSTSVYSALGAVFSALMRYILLLFYLLTTYLLHPVACKVLLIVPAHGGMTRLSWPG